jgi:penicillin-insensitive murein DD-endopeptidase
MFLRLLSPLLFSLVAGTAFASVAEDWPKITSPTKHSEPQSIGKYDAGCLGGAVTLPLDGTGYQVMRLSRKRYYGHPSLIDFIENLARTANQQKLGTLLVGDLGQPRGGPSLTGHRSHQTGLDVDIWFDLLPTEANKLTDAERENRGATSMLVSYTDDINSRYWTMQHTKVLEAASLMPEVDRIFVNPSIKRLLCADQTNHTWLRKIRPWWKHDDHFHVRLKCPSGSPHCVSQAVLPEGSGCDASLAYWFSEEAKHPKKPRPKPGKPHMPERCDAVLFAP